LEPAELVLAQAQVLVQELAQAQVLVLEQVPEQVPEQVKGSALVLAQEYFHRMSADRSHRLEVGSMMQAEPH
jgi:hypothetical protein